MESVTPQQVRLGPVCVWVPERGPIIYKFYILGGAENSFQPAVELWDSAVELITPPNWEGAILTFQFTSYFAALQPVIDIHKIVQIGEVKPILSCWMS